jgi:tripartite ATP-independent transporter DctM subunit
VKLASGVVAAGGCLGILIPPSIMLILYGATAGVSVVQLYAAAFIPGIMLAGLYIVYAMGIAIIKPEVAPRLPPDQVNIPFSRIAIALVTSFIPLAALIAMVLGAILMGLATPSEAAAMGSLGSILLAVIYRSFSFAKLKESVFLTARTSAMVCWLFVGSAIFSSVFGYLGGQDLVEQFFKSLPLNTFTFLMLAQALIFVLGWPLEWTEIIVIFVPIFLPLLDDFGVDPLFFGVLVALNLQTSFLSPPVAMAAFYLKGVAPKHVRLEDIFRGCMPFIYIVVFCMIMVYVFPGIVTWLPEQLYGNSGAAGPGIQLDAPPAGGFQEEETIRMD